MPIRTILSAVLAVLVALLMVVLAPTGAAAHGKRAHVHTTASKTIGAAERGFAALAEIGPHRPASADYETDIDCSDRGCCSNGQCSGCGTALAPAAFTNLGFLVNELPLNSDSAPPSGLARDGPPQPPKFFA